MLKQIVWCVGLLISGPALAQDCPDFFRFTDFGQQDSRGGFNSGGPILRVESFTGATLFVRDAMECRQVRGIRTDGHGNPIPVVARLTYDVEKIGFDLTELSVSHVDDSKVAAETSAARHLDRVETYPQNLIRSETSLCATEGDKLSCQLVSPYSGDAPLVIYCDATDCKMPFLAMNDKMMISASWAVSDTFWSQPDAMGDALTSKVQSIYAFLEPLASGI